MTLVIYNVRIVDATGRPPLERGWLSVDGSRIVEIGRGDPGPVGPDVEVLDADGLTAVPGLIDCHTHVAGLHLMERHARDRPGDEGARAAAADAIDVMAGLAAVVRSGLTTVRDCGYPHHGLFAVRDALATQPTAGPRLVLSGRAIAATAGHGAEISVQISGPDAARRAVRVESKAGAEWIKLMVTGGTATPGEAVTDVQLSGDEIRAAVEEAHNRGRQVSAHVSNAPGTMLALDGGVDSIEHGIAIDPEVARRMAAEGRWLAPSLLCTQIEATAGPESRIEAHVRDKAGAIFEQQQRSFQAALAAGVRIVAATDAQVPYLAMGGAALARELGLMVALGMSPLAALTSATRDAAAMLGLDGELGTLEVGRLADIILVPGDPLADLSVLSRPEHVIREGQRC